METPDPEWLAKLEEIRSQHRRRENYLLWGGETVLLSLTVLNLFVGRSAWNVAFTVAQVFLIRRWSSLRKKHQFAEKKLGLLVRYAGLMVNGFRLRWTDDSPELLGFVDGYPVKISNLIMRPELGENIPKAKYQLEVLADGQLMDTTQQEHLTHLGQYPMTEFRDHGYWQQERTDGRYEYLPRTADAMLERLKELVGYLKQEDISPAKVDWA